MSDTMNWLMTLATRLWMCERGSVEGDPGAGEGGEGEGEGEGAGEGAGKGANEGAGGANDGSGDGDNVIWPEKWREGMAGKEDAEGKRLARLGRFDTPGKVLDSYLELEDKFKNSDIRTPFPEDADDEVKAAWRDQQGIPAEAKGYFEGVPDGLVIGEDDEVGMTVLAEAMHGVNAPPEVVHAAMGAYYKALETAFTERAADDKTYKALITEELKELWPDFDRQMTDLDSWLGGADGDVRNKVLSSRMPDGKPLGSDPGVIKFLVSQMREINPKIIVPGLGSGDPQANILAEIAEIEGVIQNDNKTYRKDKVMNARYLALIAARDGQTVKEAVAQ